MTWMWSIPWHAQCSNGACSLSAEGSSRSTIPIETINATQTEATITAAHMKSTRACVKIDHRKARWSRWLHKFSVHAGRFGQLGALDLCARTQMSLACVLAIVVSWLTTHPNGHQSNPYTRLATRSMMLFLPPVTEPWNCLPDVIVNKRNPKIPCKWHC